MNYDLDEVDRVIPISRLTRPEDGVGLVLSLSRLLAPAQGGKGQRCCHQRRGSLRFEAMYARAGVGGEDGGGEAILEALESEEGNCPGMKELCPEITVTEGLFLEPGESFVEDLERGLRGRWKDALRVSVR